MKINNNFFDFVSKTNIAFAVFGLLLVIIGAISIYFFNQILKNVKLWIHQEIERQLKSVFDQTIGQELRNSKQLLDQEKIIEQLDIDYFLPSPQTISADDYPEEYTFLAARGFKKINFLHAYDYDKAKLSGNVVILDLVNYALVTDSEKTNKSESDNAQLLESRVAEILKNIVNRVSSKSILIVYIRPGKQRINAIDELSKSIKYYTSANTPVSLMGVVVDSAYVAYGLK
jgi:hypothetical protein